MKWIRKISENANNGTKILLQYTRYLFANWPSIGCLYFITLAGIGMFPIALAKIEALIIATFEKTPVQQNIYWLLGFYFLLSGLLEFQSYLSPILQRLVGTKLLWRLLHKLFHSICQKRLDFFDHVDNLRSIENAKTAVDWISSGPVIFFYSVGYFLTLLSSIAIIATKIPFLLFLLIPGGIIDAMLLAQKAEVDSDVEKESRSALLRSDRIESALFDRETQLSVRAQGISEKLAEENSAICNDVNKKILRTKARSLRYSFGALLIQVICHTISISLLLYKAWTKSINIAEYTLLVNAVSLMLSYCRYVFNALNKSIQVGVYTDDLDKFLLLEQQGIAETSSPDTETLSGNTDFKTCLLNFQNVSFSYYEREQTLHDITFQLYPGQILALVGENGSGKSTLIKLALGLYEANEGRIFRNCSVFDISAVFQDYAKYSFTLRDNVGFGDLALLENDEAIRNALWMSGAESIIDHGANGIDTSLGKAFDESGMELSEGEWQKVAIARCLIGKKLLIVYDEPTAALDPISELEYLTEIRKRLEDSAVLIVSHRIAVCRMADNILFLKDGELLETGTHDELLTKNGAYKTFYHEQSKWYRADKKSSGTMY